jgi:hypothetical protein
LATSTATLLYENCVPGGGELRQWGEAGDVLLQRVVALTEVLLVVAQPPRAVVEALAQCHLGQPLPDRPPGFLPNVRRQMFCTC